MKILFVGSSDFGIPMYESISKQHDVVGVVTSKDSPIQKISKVKTFVPEKLKDESFLQSIKKLNADLFVVVAFRMLPEVFWRIPPKGTINLHASLLPKYRGAAPIHWAVINGEKKTGVTTFYINNEIDKGNIILQDEVTIEYNETCGQIYEKLQKIGTSTLDKTIDLIYKNQAIAFQQIGESSLAPKIFKETCLIDWNKSVKDVYNFIRGMNPYPGAYTILNGKMFKIFDVWINESPQKTDNKTFLNYPCSDGTISVLSCQLEGRKKMSIEDFLKGHKI